MTTLSDCTCRAEDEVAPQAERAVEDAAALLRGRFRRTRARRHAADYLRGLVADVERKNGWQLAERMGYRHPRGIQRVLDRYAWDADLVRDDLRAYVVAALGDGQGVLVVDETGFPKQGRHSAGVARQYCGTLGKRGNCQIGVFLGYAGPKGHAGLDRALYLPQEWTEDAERRRAAGVPEVIAFQTKPQLAIAMVERALDAGVPAAWVAGDEVYGGDSKFRAPLEERGQAYVLAVRRNQPLSTWPPYGAPDQWTVAEYAATIPADAWRRLRCGEGAQGPRVYDWAYRPARPATRGPTPEGQPWAHGLLVRRHPERPDELAYYLVYAPPATPLEELARVAGARWTIDDMFKLAKGQVGLDQYEVRSWRGWYRHITLALLAFAALTVAARQKGGPTPPAPATSPSPCPRPAASWSASSGPPPIHCPLRRPSPHGPAGVAATRRSPRSATADAA
ncbi:MAG TPA: IS701 family transposase [Gammaproteobacteria bacterium]|nr:IS701 family transposase [Gammaproteobacteria bacterium]